MASDKGLQTKFELFCKSVGETEKKLSLENVKKWFRQAGILGDQKEVSDSDVSKAFSEVAKEKQAIDYSEVKELIGNLCIQKSIDPQQLMRKLSGSPQESGGPPDKSGGPPEKSGGPPEKAEAHPKKVGAHPKKVEAHLKKREAHLKKLEIPHHKVGIHRNKAEIHSNKVGIHMNKWEST
ncbi:EF-hand domain-containing protein [Trichonephila inaurata madagascariensis]|uniref:EF-hand domain-containing protein n=1 Tax=Trichonephila inaurata madagascariensis TaxID=2747483 RepID=A0A8X7BP31_9ARAC|nr:EF-hand domain-containing protein [Trichonephila inaurata madagascariensis]